MYAVSGCGNKTEKRYTNLASKLGDTEGQPETSPLVDVGLEVFELDVVPMDEHLVDVAVTAAPLEEIGHPIKAVGSRSGDGASESVTLVGKRPEVLVPNADSGGGIRLSLRVFVDPEKREIDSGGRTWAKPTLRTH